MHYLGTGIHTYIGKGYHILNEKHKVEGILSKLDHKILKLTSYLPITQQIKK